MPAPYHLAEALRSGETIFIGWIGMTDPLFAETAARSNFGAITLDMQHGWHDPVSVMHSISAIVMGGKPAIVRVPVGDFAFASRALDMGAECIIAPMINTVEEARTFVDAVKYPPVGKRSWGPSRGMALSGIQSSADYLTWANGNVIALAMIETREAIANLDAILAVPGLDGVFVGPSDLSLTLSDGAIIDGGSPTILGPVAEIIAATKAHGKIPAMFGVTPEHSKALAAQGFQLITIGTDTMGVLKGFNDLIAAASA